MSNAVRDRILGRLRKALETEGLPVPPETTHIMLDSKAAWVDPAVGDGDRCHGEYPDESLADWHKRHGAG